MTGLSPVHAPSRHTRTLFTAGGNTDPTEEDDDEDDGDTSGGRSG
jgi:hypothetical protein